MPRNKIALELGPPEEVFRKKALSKAYFTEFRFLPHRVDQRPAERIDVAAKDESNKAVTPSADIIEKSSGCEVSSFMAEAF